MLRIYSIDMRLTECMLWEGDKKWVDADLELDKPIWDIQN